MQFNTTNIFIFVFAVLTFLACFFFFIANCVLIRKLEKIEKLVDETDEKLLKEYFGLKFYRDVKEVLKK